MNTLAQQTLDTIKIVVLAAMLVVGMQYVFAGPPAGAIPPECPPGQPGCDPPVNVGNTYQAKIGNGIGADWFGAFSMKIIDSGGHEDILLTADNGITVSDGNIESSNGAVKGASIENLGGTAKIDSAGAITGASGSFSGGVAVGTGASESYLTIDTTANAPSGACVSAGTGAMILGANRVYVCRTTGQWGFIDIFSGGGTGF